MVPGQRRPAGGDGFGQAGHDYADHIQISLDQERAPSLPDLVAGQVQAVQNGRFLVDRALERVEVLRSFGVDPVGSPRSKTGDLTAGKLDGKGDPSAEPVVDPTILGALSQQPSSQRLLQKNVALRQNALQILPAGRRPADAELLDGDRGETALFDQISHRVLGSLELAFVIRRSSTIHREKTLAAAPLFALPRRFILGRKLHPGLIGEDLEGLRELDALDLHDESKHVAAGFTSEAVVQALVRADLKAGRLLGMKGT